GEKTNEPSADRYGEGVGSRPPAAPGEGEGAHARARRAGGRAPAPAVGADREGLRVPGAAREGEARRPVRRAPPAPDLPFHVRTQPDGGLRRLLDVRRPGGAPRAPARARHLVRPRVARADRGAGGLPQAHGLERPVVLVLRFFFFFFFFFLSGNAAARTAPGR